MRRRLLEEACQEAGRFLRLAKELGKLDVGLGEQNSMRPGQEAAALKRASMDLTKALVRLRLGEPARSERCKKDLL